MGQVMNSRQIYVSIVLGDECLLAGTLWCHNRKGRESATFEYASSWVAQPERFALEPALKLSEGVFHYAAGSDHLWCDWRFRPLPLGARIDAPQ